MSQVADKGVNFQKGGMSHLVVQDDNYSRFYKLGYSLKR